jgi:hypothetical protein
MMLGGGLGLVRYRSRSTAEWALVGAAAGALFVASLGQLCLRPFLIAGSIRPARMAGGPREAWAGGTSSRDPPRRG